MRKQLCPNLGRRGIRESGQGGKVERGMNANEGTGRCDFVPFETKGLTGLRPCLHSVTFQFDDRVTGCPLAFFLEKPPVFLSFFRSFRFPFLPRSFPFHRSSILH